MIPFSIVLTISLITFVNVDSVYSKGPVALRTPSESVPARIPSDATYCHVMKEMMQTLHETFAGNASESLGGGAINEKRKFYCGENKELEQQQQQTASTSAENISSSFGRLYNPEQVLSHSLHATMGLDRYPNYLHRWSEYEQDIDALEHSLKQQLFVVHKQREEMLRRREGIQQLVKAVGKQLLESAIPEAATKLERNEDRGVDMPFPLRPPQSWGEVKEKVLHPSAAKVVFKSEFFSGNVLDNVTIEDFMNGKEEVKLDLALLEDWIEQEMFDVYSFPLLSEGFCNLLRNTVRKISSIGAEPNWAHLSIGYRPIDLDLIGLKWVNDLLFHLVIKPVARELFKDTEIKGELDWRHGYVAGYSKDVGAKHGLTRNRLKLHTDDSEVTLNVCVCDTFEGGSLRFCGLRGSDAEGQLLDEYHPKLGRAVLHAGRHLHEVGDVTSGDRYALIIWARSWGGVRSTTCPCCWINRRENTRCICSPQGN